MKLYLPFAEFRNEAYDGESERNYDVLKATLMSRPPQSSVDASQAELEEEEAMTGTGEGDEIMEEVEEQEGYSECLYI